ncbi:PAS domain S-box protein [Solirubrum puertoriconensis]|uniref:histidine kinase n=1 Tax=Solirubrum puertoriconensis TaxID=1751427 RepID=A0A9X0HLD9_SOLP1|nr:PAS domain S-box protein [Solirubrum puertoriconensis]KUG08079.1 hypothetical protein ASU33_07720 [Solirubrum puertoriconensis]
MPINPVQYPANRVVRYRTTLARRYAAERQARLAAEQHLAAQSELPLAAAERLQLLSELTRLTPNPAFTTDRQGRIRYMNVAAEALRPLLTTPDGLQATGFLQQLLERAVAEQRPQQTEHALADRFYIWTAVPVPETPLLNVYLTNVSTLRQTEAELRRSQHLLARINDTLPTLVFLYDVVERRLLYANDQAEALLGCSAAELQRLGAPELRQLLHPDDLPLLDAQVAAYQHLPEGQLQEAELRFWHCGGYWRWLSLKTTVFSRDEAGRVRQLIGSAEDITERRAAAEELARSRHFLGRVADTVPSLIYLYDLLQGRNLYCNRQLAPMLGYAAADLQLMGNAMFDKLVFPDDLPAVAAHHQRLQQALDGELISTEYRVRRRDGALCWLRVRESVFARNASGAPSEIIGSAEDITQEKLAETERRRAHQQAAEQSRLVRQVIDSVPHLVYLKNEAGQYVLANEATAELFGLSVEELEGLSAGALYATDAEAAQRYHQQDQEVVTTHRQVEQEESIRRPDGKVLCFHSIKRPFVQADGTVLVLGVDSNITELKRAQQELRRAKEAAEENARVKQEFLANMSHEVRTPLNGILGMAGLLARSPLSTEQQRYLGLIKQSADHLLVVINDVLSAAQLGSGKLQLECIAFDLHTLLHDTLDSLQLRAAEKDISLHLELPIPAPALVRGDPHRVRQIVLNLLGNAIKFTEQGRVTLSGQWLPNRAQPTFHLTVEDTGIGIEPHQLASIFEPFTQASASTAREFGGSGLGLSISRGLAKLLGGRIWAESEPGLGSTFHVELPLPPALAPPPALNRHEQPAAPELAGIRVLLVEDNAVNQLFAASLLRGWGVQFDTAANGLEALQLFDTYRFDVVLMDIRMPVLDGLSAAVRMRNHPEAARAATPIVALTAHALPGEARRCRETGFSEYLSKPFREDELLRVLRQVTSANQAVGPATGAGLPQSPAIAHAATGDAGFRQRLAELFVQTTPPAVERLVQHFRNHEWAAMSDAAHFLKSSFAGMELHHLLPAVRLLEAAGKPGTAPQPAQLAAAVEQVRTAAEQLVAELRQQCP